jgi:hypothetical protein
VARWIGGFIVVPGCRNRLNSGKIYVLHIKF